MLSYTSSEIGGFFQISFILGYLLSLLAYDLRANASRLSRRKPMPTLRSRGPPGPDHTLVLRRSCGAELLQFRKILLAELDPAQRIVAVIVLLEPSQVHAADFPGNRLGQFPDELDAPDALERRKMAVQMLEDRERGFLGRLGAGDKQHIGLRDGQPDRIGRRHHGRFRHCVMLDQNALQFERADAIVGRFEDVIGAADEGEIAFLVDKYDIAAAIDRAIRA